MSGRPLNVPVPTRREWTIASDIRHIEPLVSEVVNLCLEAGLSARVCRLNVPVALTEALSNAIVCGNRENVDRAVTTSFVLDENALTLEVTDDGEGFDPTSVTFSPDDADWLEREDGRGLFLMRSLMDCVELQRPSKTKPGLTVRLVLNRT
ncbi:MAG: ATP-binding protein [Phycisphaerae bacterium]|nr:ATP-binding protein [Gemmatimonadaceae bacterium]